MKLPTSSLLWVGVAAGVLQLPVEGAPRRPLREVVAPRRVATTTAVTPVRPGERAQSLGFVPVRRFQGNLTLAQAVRLALRQNPQLLRSLQEIERTRGLIIEVRAAALPHLSVTGSYNMQDRRLLETGGGGVGAGNGQGVQDNAFAAVTEGAARDVSGTGNVDQGGSGTDPSSNASTQAAEFDDILQRLAEASTNGDAQNVAVQDKSWNITFQVRQALYTGGQITSALKVAKFSQDSAYYSLHDTLDVIIAQVRQQFYTVLLNRELITVAEENVRLARQQLQDQQNRFEAGTVPRFNVLRAEVEVSNVEPVLIRARNDYLLAQLQLAKSLGLEPGPLGNPEFTCVGELSVVPRRMSLADSLNLARARRPYFKVQRQSILIDAEQIQLEMAGYRPRFDANAGYTFRNRRTSEDLEDVVNGWFLGVTGSWDIFDGFETYGRVKQARARLEQSRVTYNDSVLQVELEVQTAFANLEVARETIESQRKNVEQAVEALRLATERFSAGAGTQLEVLDARVALTRARSTEVQARADYNRFMAEFDRVTATDTIYERSFKDPLEKKEKGILGKIAETGLPKSRDAKENR